MLGVTPWSQLVCVSQWHTLKRYAAVVIVSDCGLSPQDAWGDPMVTAGVCQPVAYTEEVCSSGYCQWLWFKPSGCLGWPHGHSWCVSASGIHWRGMQQWLLSVTGLSPRDAQGGPMVMAGVCQPMAYIEEVWYQQLLLPTFMTGLNLVLASVSLPKAYTEEVCSSGYCRWLWFKPSGCTGWPHSHGWYVSAKGLHWRDRVWTVIIVGDCGLSPQDAWRWPHGHGWRGRVSTVIVADIRNCGLNPVIASVPLPKAYTER